MRIIGFGKSSPRWGLAIMRIAVCCLGGSAGAQVQAFVDPLDGDQDAADYVTFGFGQPDIRFDFNYGDFRVFDDTTVDLLGFLPPAPRTTDGSTTGIFISGNSDSLGPNAGTPTIAAFFPSGLEVGAGTTTPNFVFRFDAWHNTGTGFFRPDGELQFAGTTTYALAGLNYSAAGSSELEVGIRDLTGLPAGQGIALAITADGRAAEDYLPIYGGATYSANPTPVPLNRAYGGPGIETGLPNQGAEVSPGFPGDAGDPYWQAGFPVTSGPPAVALVAPGGHQPDLLDSDELHRGGVPFNRWATHELYWFDETFFYFIDGYLVLERAFDDDPTSATQNTFDEISRTGTVMLGFWDRFPSIANSPEGANFVVYDNLEVRPVDAVPEPAVMSMFLVALACVRRPAGAS